MQAFVRSAGVFGVLVGMLAASARADTQDQYPISETAVYDFAIEDGRRGAQLVGHLQRAQRNDICSG